MGDLIQQDVFEKLVRDFAAFGYELVFEPQQQNPYVIVRISPRRILWRTRATHVIAAILATIKMERKLV